MNRHISALIITLSVYNLPEYLYTASGLMWFIDMGLWGLFYILMISLTGRTRTMWALIGIECFSILSILIAFFESQIIGISGLLYQNLSVIIEACYISQLLLIVGGMASGLANRHTISNDNDAVNHSIFHWSNLFRKGSL